MNIIVEIIKGVDDSFNLGEKIYTFRFSVIIDPLWANIKIGMEMVKGVEHLIYIDANDLSQIKQKFASYKSYFSESDLEFEVKVNSRIS